MSDFTLTYRSGVPIENLMLNECTIRPCRLNDGDESWWNLWFYVARETDGVPQIFEAHILPRSPFIEYGPGGRGWGFNDEGGGVWQVSPSINILNTGDGGKLIHPGPHPTLPSLWHKTPSVVGVPAGEPWDHPAPSTKAVTQPELRREESK